MNVLIVQNMKTLLPFLPYDLTPTGLYMLVYAYIQPVYAQIYIHSMQIHIHSIECIWMFKHKLSLLKKHDQNVPLTPDKFVQSQNQAKNKQWKFGLETLKWELGQFLLRKKWIIGLLTSALDLDTSEIYPLHTEIIVALGTSCFKPS